MEARLSERDFLLLDGIIATAVGLILPLGLDSLVVKPGWPPNSRMQQSGQGGSEFPSGAGLLVAKQWKRQFVGAGMIALQLMRKSLGGRTSTAKP